MNHETLFNDLRSSPSSLCIEVSSVRPRRIPWRARRKGRFEGGAIYSVQSHHLCEGSIRIPVEPVFGHGDKATGLAKCALKAVGREAEKKWMHSRVS